jgi:hypothetical protein
MESDVEAVVCDGCGKLPWMDTTNNKSIPLKKCSRCHQSSYHDVECQRRHYNIHKASCRISTSKSINLSNDSSLGKKPAHVTQNPNIYDVRLRPDAEHGLFATQGMVPVEFSQNTGTGSIGKIIFRPLVHPILLDAYRKSYCANCFQKLTKNRKSTTLCDNPRYPVRLCSKECQDDSKEWLPTETKIIQEILKMDSDMILLPVAVLLYRLLNVESRKEAMTMKSHTIIRTNSTKDEGELLHSQAVQFTVARMILQTQLYMCKYPPLHDDLIAEVLQRVKFNSFTLTSDDNSAVGVAIFEGPSYRINHSCLPNAIQKFIYRTGRSPQLCVELIKPVKVDDEICITYIENLDTTTQNRQNELWKRYNFICKCFRCMNEA